MSVLGNVPRYLPGRHIPEHMLQHVPGNVSRHMPGYESRHIPKHLLQRMAHAVLMT